jgi:transcriptional regulator with XRE-family HTH domain
MRFAREALGITRQELADRVGCAAAHIDAIETRRTKPDPVLRDFIALELGISPEEVGR